MQVAGFPADGAVAVHDREVGRGQDFAWSATTANTDIVDEFVEIPQAKKAVSIYEKMIEKVCMA